MPRLLIGFSHIKFPLLRNGLLLNGVIRGMLKEKVYSAVDIVFPIVSGFDDRVPGYKNSPNVTTAHAMYISLMNSVFLAIGNEDEQAKN